MNAEADIAAYSRERAGPKVEISGHSVERSEEVLTPLSLQLLTSLQRRFNPRRLELLAAREARQAAFDTGGRPALVPAQTPLTVVEYASGDRTGSAPGNGPGNWTIAGIPADLHDRRVETTGPVVDRKTTINALNAPVSCFTADLEDACSPTWGNIIRSQINLRDAIRGNIMFADPQNGRVHRLAKRTATLIVRPRGWHLPEKHVRIGGEEVSGALFDFALYIANNYAALARRGTGPYFCLPKLESHLEARLWNDVFVAAQDALGLKRGTIKATVLIETLPAAFEMDAILFELREHCVGLNCDRWDYIFSFIKKLRRRPDCLLPDRAAMTAQQPFLKSQATLLLQTCQRRGAQASSEMPVLSEVSRSDLTVSAADLLQVPAGDITEHGLRNCIRVGVQYLESWLRGDGCVPLYNRTEDAAAAESCRAQLWQAIRHGARTSDGRPVTEGRFDLLLSDELDRIHGEVGPARLLGGVFPTAARLFAEMIKQETFDEFLTLPAYDYLS
jgi:malate synthase